MTEIIHGIVLQTIKHSDRHNIVTLYTRERGRVSFLSPGGVSKSGRTRNSILSPLAAIEARVNFKPSRELQILGGISLYRIRRNIYFHPVKSSLVLFISELLASLLKVSEPEPHLYDFILKSTDFLDECKSGIANFHIAFLVNLLYFTGIRPDISSYRSERLFDMREGTFVDGDYGHIAGSTLLSSQESRFIPTLARMTYRNMHKFTFSGQRRSEIVDYLLRYYSIHLPVSPRLRTIEIIKEIFN